MALTLTPLVRSVPLTASGHDFYRYKESRVVGSEADADGDPKRLQARQQAIDDGKLSAEEFDKAFAATPKAWYKAAAAEIAGSIRSLEELDEVSRERFGDASPNNRPLQDALAEVQHVAHQLLGRKLELEPDPPELDARPAESSAGPYGATRPEPMGASSARAPAAEPADRDDAATRAVSAARFLRRTEPGNPASYLILRALRWGELRVDSEGPDPRLLEAPPPQARSQLRRLQLEGKWEQLLEAAEQVMGTPAGRGWLDLQRYTLSACAGLGDGFHQVARAVAHELSTLLSELPGLPEMTLMDDMPTASRETQQWLHEMGFGNGTEAVKGAVAARVLDGEARSVKAADAALDRAMAEVGSGRPERGIELLMAEVARERSPRARFLRRTQIARIMVDAGMERIAMPILLDLLALIETHGLAQWEAGEQVAEPMALLYRCLLKLPDEPAGEHTLASLHPRICSLDPMQAIHLSRP